MCSDIRNLALVCFTFLLCASCGCGGGASNESAMATPQPSATEIMPAPPPLDSRPKVVAFGDSLTNGFDDWRKTYPTHLQADLDRAGFDFQVVNRGRGGDTSAQGLARLDEAFTTGQVRIFILELGVNDLFKNVPLDETRASLSEIIRRVKGRGAKILFCGYEIEGDPEMATAVKQMYADLARENDVAFLPSILAGVQQHPELLSPDGRHPNEAGARVEEQNVWNALQPLLVNEPRTKK